MASNKWKEIRDHYLLMEPEILDARPWVYGVDPYAWDGKDMIHMTPIEWLMWQDIRLTGLVMYPQYPVAGFFVDFGNPVSKVAIECDGAQWHDPMLDAKRDAILAKHGWTVYRMSGRDCKKIGAEDDDGHCLPSPAEALCLKIGRNHQMIARYAEVKESSAGWIDMREACNQLMDTLRARMERKKALGM